MASAAHAGNTTQIIKLSIVYRAKYRVDPPKVISPLLVVPHPKNRGGDPVKSLRTMQLMGTVTFDGYDPVEANSNGVVVEQRPAVAGEVVIVFQDAFASKLKIDPDMAERSEGIVAIAGSLSHSHLNCGMRNILGGKRGCECPEGKNKCKCSSSPIWDDEGNYSLEKLEAYDKDWARDCQTGLNWERLS